jgi:nucleoside-diphosphate-sugar epimerase
MKILLTGHRGFIGSSLLKALELNHTVTGIDLVDGDDLLTYVFDQEYDYTFGRTQRCERKY